jgi:hypothetical protein
VANEPRVRERVSAPADPPQDVGGLSGLLCYLNGQYHGGVRDRVNAQEPVCGEDLPCDGESVGEQCQPLRAARPVLVGLGETIAEPFQEAVMR